VLVGLVLSPVVTLMFGVALLPFSWPYLAAVPILLGTAVALSQRRRGPGRRGPGLVGVSGRAAATPPTACGRPSRASWARRATPCPVPR
jgi:hypothetical protein